MKKEYPIDITTYPFKVHVPVQIRFNDLDGYGHANNSAEQSFFDIGRAAYLQQIHTDGDFYSGQQVLLVVSYTTDFMRQIHFHDDIEVRTAVYHIGTKSLKMIMAIIDTQTGQTCSVCDSVMAAYDKTTQKSITIPDIWRKKISELEGKEL